MQYSMEKDNGLLAGSADWIKIKKSSECTKDPLTCVASTFINVVGSRDMKVRCAKSGATCSSLAVFSR
jgi:hypothetical protein